MAVTAGGRHPVADRRFRTVASLGVALSALVVALSVGIHYAAYRVQLADPGAPPLPALAWFDVNAERNVPTAWSTGLLLASGALAARRSSRRLGRPRQGWLLVGATSTYLALDEWLQLHERLGSVGTAVVGSALHFAWVVPGAAAALLVGSVALVRLRAQPPDVRRRLTLAASVYVTGALVMETASGLVLQRLGPREAYVAVTAVEEFLEMAGACVLLATVVAARTGRGGQATPAWEACTGHGVGGAPASWASTCPIDQSR